MTVTHLGFALVTTAYILIAIQLEERDLMKVHPEYARYREQIPMLVPGLGRRAVTPHAPAVKVAPRDSFCLYGSEILSQVGDPLGHCTLGGLRLGGEDSPPYRHILVSVCWKTLCHSETKDALNVSRGVLSSMTLGQCGQIRYLISQRGCSWTTALPV